MQIFKNVAILNKGTVHLSVQFSNNENPNNQSQLRPSITVQ